MLDFQKKCIKEFITVVIDGHIITSDSNDNDVKGKQMNLLVALDIATYLPLAIKVFPSYLVGKTDFIEFKNPLGEIKSMLFIMDTGFYQNRIFIYCKTSGKLHNTFILKLGK